MELGGHLVNNEFCLIFFSHRLSMPQSKEEGEGKRLLYHDTRN